jgi:hypothetical protein
MTLEVLFAFALGSGASIPSFESFTSDSPHISQSSTPSNSDVDRIKTIVTLSVVCGVGVIVVIILVALCCCSRAEIKTAAPVTDLHARTTYDAFWRTYTDTEDLSAASAWSESARSTTSFAGPADVLCPICHAKHAHAVDLGLPRELQEPCLKAMGCPQQWRACLGILSACASRRRGQERPDPAVAREQTHRFGFDPI